MIYQRENERKETAVGDDATGRRDLCTFRTDGSSSPRVKVDGTNVLVLVYVSSRFYPLNCKRYTRDLRFGFIALASNGV